MINLKISYLISLLITLTLASGPDMYYIQPGKPTLVDVPYFNRTADADFIKGSMQTLNQELVLKLAQLGSMRSRNQRLEILETFKERYSMDLVKEYLSHEVFDSDLGVLTRALFMSRAEFLAREIHWAIDGLGTDENTLTDIFCCMDPKEIAYTEIEKAYSRLYEDEQIPSDVVMDVSGPYKFLLRNLMYNRNNKTNDTNAKLIASTYFNDINTGQFLKMEQKYKTFLSRSSYDEIYRTAHYFWELRKVTLGSHLNKVTSLSNYGFFTSNYWLLMFAGNNFPELVMAIVNYSTDKIGYYLDLIIKGFQERDYRRAIRAIALRADNDLELVKLRYRNEHSGERTLALEVISKDPVTSLVGDKTNYIRLLLIKIICGNRDPDRDLDLVQQWDKTKQCPGGDMNCGVTIFCVLDS